MTQNIRIVVIGGTGLIGTQLVAKLREQGHEVVAASRSNGINAVTGEGLTEALQGAQVVVDVANSSTLEPKDVAEFFAASTRNLLAAEAKAGVQHHIALSIVGIDRTPRNYYFEAKLAQEKLIEAGSIPYTILRATQFFEFLDGLVAFGTHGDTVHLSPVMFQPLASSDVVNALVDISLSEPTNGIIDIGGPETRPLNQFVARYLEAKGDNRQIQVDAEPHYFGTPADDKTLVADAKARVGVVKFEEWLKRTNTGASE